MQGKIKHQSNNGPKHFTTRFSFYLLMISLLLTSCSAFIEVIDDKNNSIPLKQQAAKTLSCQSNDAIAAYSIQDTETLNELFAREKLSLEEELIMSILQQMAVRPATTSPNARLQIALMDKNGQWELFDYYRPKSQRSLWQGLYDLTSRLKLKPLEHYLKMANDKFPHSMEIGSNFAMYLQQYQQNLHEQNKSLPFFKAGQLIKKGESIPTPNWIKLPYYLGKKTSFPPLRAHNFKVKSLNDVEASCNFDLDLYAKSVYLVGPHPGVNYNAVARIKNNRAFLFISSVELQSPQLTKGTRTLLEQTPATRPIPLCLINSANNALLLTSLRGRDPGQHLFHLLQYSISTASKIEDVQTYLSFARHQFLYSPARMLYESGRSSQVNMETFLRMDFPIYHVSKLGDVWGIGSFQDEKNTLKLGLAIDEREAAELSCQGQP